MKKLSIFLFMIASLAIPVLASEIITATVLNAPIKEIISIDGMSQATFMGTSEPVIVNEQVYGVTDRRCSQQITWLKNNARKQGTEWIMDGERYIFDSTACKVFKEVEQSIPEPCGDRVHWIDQLSRDAKEYYNLVNVPNQRLDTPLKRNICHEQHDVKVEVDTTLPIA